jgi:lysophospholipase L1-like esterase
MAKFTADVVPSNEWGTEATAYIFPEQYTRRLLVEGDSWMHLSSALTGSLPEYLTFENKTTLVVNCANSGDELTKIVSCLKNGDFLGWLTDSAPVQFDGILLSFGGNDFIAAARDEPAGEGILMDMKGRLPVNAKDCINTAQMDQLITYLDTNWRQLYGAICNSSKGSNLPLLLNMYAVPVPRDAPAVPGGLSYLYTAFEKNHIPSALRDELAAYLFMTLQDTIKLWASAPEFNNVYLVPTDTVALTPAKHGDAGRSGDWMNEIHPSPSGWRKLAKAWESVIDTVIL